MESEPQEVSAESGAMSDDELASLLASHETSAVGYYTSEIADEQAKAINYYYGRPFGDEVTGKSQVVDRTVAIVVDNAVAAIMKPFVSADDAVCFEPVGPEDEEAAEQATEYVNYVFQVDNRGFLIMHNWFKAALLEKVGIVKCWWEDSERKERQTLEGLDAMALEQLIQEQGEEYKIIEGPYQDDEFFSCVVEHSVADGRVKIETVPSEEFLLSPFARDIETAPYAAHRPTNITRSDLIDMGFDPEVVDTLPAAAQDSTYDPRSLARNEDEQFASSLTPMSPGGDRSLDKIAIIDEYVRVDYNGDGIAEMRRVVRVDSEILLNMEVDENPFSIVCPVPMPHKVYGLSLADQTVDLQRISSVLWRQMLDNLYLTNDPAMELPQAAQRTDGSTTDDLQETGPGRVIRTAQGGLLSPITVPFVAADTFPMLEYAERQQEARTGISRNGQGLDTNALRKGGQMTATEAADMISGKNSRSEMIARIFAETGVKRLFRTILRLVVRHQPRERIIRLRNKWVTIDPRSWNAEMDVSISVGLGVGSKVEQIAQADSVLQTLAEVIQSPFAEMVTDENAYHAVKRKLVAAGAKDVENYITEPPKGPDGKPVPKEPKPDPEMAKVQAEAALQQQKLQGEQLASAAKIELQKNEALAKQDLARQQAEFEAQLATEKARFEAQLAEQKFNQEMELAERQMAMQEQLSERKAALAEQTLPKNRPGGSLSE